MAHRKRNIEAIIHKFLINSATTEEIEFLTEWVKDNKPKFAAQVELHHLISGTLSKERALELKKELLENFETKQGSQKRLIASPIFRYAAIFLRLIAVGLFYVLNKENDEILQQNEVTITLGDGTNKEVAETDSPKMVSRSTAYVAEQKGNTIVYKKVGAIDQEPETLVYNTLYVPYGKKFLVVLSDSTKIHLNSGSSLTYPVIFPNKGPRNVMLRGEGYFEVESESLRPFYVNTKFLAAEVLGTEFNVSAYEDDQQTRIVLVEGSLNVNKGNSGKVETVQLKPRQMASYSYRENVLTSKNVDISGHVAWKDGVLLFKNEDFYQITKKLERHFNINIDIDEDTIGKERYTGRFETETIEEVLNAFQRIKKFDYAVNNDKIQIINPK